MTRSATRTLALALVAALNGLAAYARPNFSGDWKLNTAKSDFGALPPPSSMSQKITHEEPSMKVAMKMSGDNGDMAFDSTYSTDGKESVNQFGPGTLKTIAGWEGDVLVFKSKGDFGDGEVAILDRWQLSEDGKTINLYVRISGSQGEIEQKLVFDKQ